MSFPRATSQDRLAEYDYSSPHSPLVHSDSSNSISKESYRMSSFSGAGSAAGAGAVGYADVVDPQSMYASRMAARRSQTESQLFASQEYKEPAWLPNPQRKSRKWLYIGLAALAIIVIAVGVGVGVKEGLKNGDNQNRTSSSANSSGSSGSTSNATSTAGSDPSVFNKDPALKKSFWGIAYTRDYFQEPWCGATQDQVNRDMQLLSQLTPRLRLYGADCNQTGTCKSSFPEAAWTSVASNPHLFYVDRVLQAIQDTKVDMKIWIAVYVSSNTTDNAAQIADIQNALQTYGTDHVEGITYGNEYILNSGGTAASIQTITSGAAALNSTIKALGLNKKLPIGTADAGSELTVTLAEGIDYFQANVHPWFAEGVTIENAATWTWDFFQQFDVDIAAQAPNNPGTSIAETGWPTESMNKTNPNKVGVSGSVGAPSEANLQTFLDTFVCQANANGTQYFFFEAFDEPWKEQFGGVEPYWGLFTSNNTLKNITIPDCLVS